jgi:hypothetical protein
MATATATKPQVSSGDWFTVKAVAKAFSIDPYLLVAIGMHETGWGTRGDGRPPPTSHAHILGVGSYDSGSTDKWAGLSLQLVEGAIILRKNGVHTIGDVQAGKLHVQNGAVKWASDDTAAKGYPWSTSVVKIATQLEGAKVYDTGKLPATSSAYDTDDNRATAANLIEQDQLPPVNNGIVNTVIDGVVGGGIAKGIEGAASGAVSTATAIPHLIGWLMNPKNLLRIAMVQFGAILIVLAILALVRGVTPMGQLASITSKLKGSK